MSGGAKLVQVGGKTLDLPWLPTAHELAGWAPEYASTARPGRAPIMHRATDPVPTQRIEFTLRQRDMRESIAAEIEEIKAFAAGKPLVRLVIGSHDYGAYQITEAGGSITAYAADGSPARAEVMIDMTSSVTAVAKIGPVKAKAKKKGKK